MAILITRDFETGVSYTTGAEGTDQFYSAPQVGIDEFGDPVTEHIEIYDLDARTGTQCLKFEIEKGIYRDDYPLCRSEVRTQVFGGNPDVLQGWIAFSFKALTVTTGEETGVIAQLWDGGSPSMSIRWRFSDNSVFLRVYNNVSSTDYQICNVSDGAWHDIVMWYQARQDSTGKVKIWHNLNIWSGTGITDGVLNRQNIYTPELDGSTPYWKFGNYSSSFGEGDLDNRASLMDNVNHADDNDTDVVTFELLDPEGRQALSGITYPTYEGPDYYVSNLGSDSDDGSSGLPFATVNKALGEISPGGTIYINRGDEFYEELDLLFQGTLVDPITLDVYGTGDLPVITGFKTLSSWSSLGDGLYSCTEASITQRVNVLIVDDVVQPPARLPKTSYYDIVSRTGGASGTITDGVNLTGTPSYVGAEIVIRKNAWVLDRGDITGHSGSTLTYAGTSVYNSQVGYGYFIQNKRELCTELHEWCREGSDIIMYFGAENPGDYVIKASVLSFAVNANNRDNHIFRNIRFTGFNGVQDGANNNNYIPSFQFVNSENITFEGCEFQYHGNVLFSVQSSNNFQVKENCIIRDVMNMVMWNRTASTSPVVNISNNIIERIGIVPGAGGNSDEAYSFFSTSDSADGTIIEGNTISYVGYNGISINGYEYLVKNNFLQYCCYLMDDGACIYTYKGDSDKIFDKTKRIIEYNICLDSPGNNDGKPSGTLAGEGIYVDDNASLITGDEITVRFNTCSGNRLGLKLHNCRDMSVTDNMFYDNLEQVKFASDTITNTNIRNIEFKRNQLYAVDTQAILIMDCKDNSPQLYGDFNDNYYMRPSNESDIITVNFDGSPSSTETYSLAEWKAAGLAHDENTKGTPTTSELVMFLYNKTLTPEVVPLDNVHLDIDGIQNDTGEITIGAFESELLLDDLGPVVPTPPNNNPVVSISSPATDLTFYTGTPIDFVTSATDPDAGDSVVQLDLYYGPNTIEKRTAPPQGENLFTWSVPVVGEWLIMLIATDSEGAMKSTTINMTVEVPNETPTAVIVVDVDSGEAPLDVQFTGDGSTDDVGVVSYLWDFDDTTTSTLANPLHTFAAGNYNVSLTVTDGGGLTDTAFRLITVTVPNTLPEIEITSPPNGAVYPEGATIRFFVDASDVDDNLLYVDFRADGISIGESYTAPYTFDWDTAIPGAYSVVARAFDEQGFTDSAAITITVNEVPLEPTFITIRGRFQVIETIVLS